MGSVLSMVVGWWSGGTQVGAAVTYAEDGDLGPDADLPDPTTGLTLRHRTAMTRTWALVRPDVKLHGVNFFLALFEKEPLTQTRFKGLSNLSVEQLRNSKRLVAHGTTVMMSISSLVDTIDDPPVLVELLMSIGHNHKGRGIPLHDFELLVPVLLQYLKDNLGSHYTPVAEEAWTQALKAIISVVATAYNSQP